MKIQQLAENFVQGMRIDGILINSIDKLEHGYVVILANGIMLIGQGHQELNNIKIPRQSRGDGRIDWN